ncbi:hypothetical protein DKW60_18650 [Leucothrix pacifica]|uniref:Ricin B lectin domain-containing protein n=2 Tax=Leucothrix pacifica TaxID=1247513 RepID=A0A317C988_9GAMM|nr:hypothetical protein DKW60_18650 [Leucothrix pacifica]
MTLFKESDSGVFHDLASGKLLKTITDQQRTVYLEQDGDIFEEDVATLDDQQFGLQSTYSFSRSKRLLGTEVYTDHLLAFYSGCRYRLYQKKFIPVKSSCGFSYRKNKARSERIEWEHIVPAWHFGHQLRCWQDGGRLHCRNNNEKFREMEADMHNLVPAIGEINGDRSNYKYSMIANEPRLYGSTVNMEVAFKSSTAEPPENVMGDIARAYFYMTDQYQLQISDQQKKLFIAWNNMDPVDDWEREKNQRVKALQNTENKYITHYKKLQQNEVVTSSPDTDFDSITRSLRERFNFLFDYLPVQIAEVVILLGAAYLFWRNRRKKKAEQEDAAGDTADGKGNAADNQATETTSTPKNNPSPTQDSDPEYVKIRSAMNQYVLSIEDDGQLVVEKSSRAHAQRWQLIPSNKTEGYVFIQHLDTNKVLAVENGLKKDDAPVILEEKKRVSNNHQEWKLVPTAADENLVFIQNRETELVLDISHNKSHSGAAVATHRRKSRNTDNQCWGDKLTPMT